MEATSTFQVKNLTVKVGLNDDLRRFSFTGNFAALRKDIATGFNLDATNIALKYKDNEGDSITLANDRDLAEARTACGDIMRITVFVSKPISAAPSPSVPVVPNPPSPVVNDDKADKKKEKQDHRAAKEALKEQKRHEKDAAKAFKKEHHKGPKTPREKLEARFVKDVTVEDGSEMLPGASFVKTWRFRNEGARAWPAGGKLIFVSKEKGDKMGGPDEVPAPTAEAGAEADVSVPFVAPSEPGRYVGFWRLCTSEGKKFGQRVRVLIYVPAPSSSSESDSTSLRRATPRKEGEKKKEHKKGDEKKDQKAPTAEQVAVLEQLQKMGFDNQKRNLRLLQKFDGDLAKVLTKLAKNKKLDTPKKKTDDM